MKNIRVNILEIGTILEVNFYTGKNVKDVFLYESINYTWELSADSNDCETGR